MRASGEWGTGSGKPDAEDIGADVVYPLGTGHGLVADGAIRSYRDLRVWQEGMDLVEAVYSATERFPSHERFGLTSQLQRSAASVPSNIAEGWGRGRTNEYLQFLRCARASLKEVETQWLIAGRLGFLEAEAVQALDEQGQRLGRQILSLMRALR